MSASSISRATLAPPEVSILALCDAARRGDTAQIERQCAGNPKLINAFDPSGKTPLFVATSNQREKAVSMLLGFSARPYISCKGGTPFDCALKKRFDGVVQVYLNPTFNINPSPVDILEDRVRSTGLDYLGPTAGSALEHFYRDEERATPLHATVLYSCVEIAARLLEKGADPNTKTEAGNTPLHLAARDNRSDFVELLLRYGSKLGVPNARGCFPFELNTRPLSLYLEGYRSPHSEDAEDA